jgi:hypothetical protein
VFLQFARFAPSRVSNGVAIILHGGKSLPSGEPRPAGRGGTIRTMRRIDRLLLTASLVTGFGLGAVLAASDTPQRSAPRAAAGPGAAAANSAGGKLVLFNSAVSGTWKIEDDRFEAVSFDDRENGRTIVLSPAVFSLVLDDGRVLQASDMKVTAAPRIETLAGDSRAARMVERLPGRQIVVTLESADPGLRATWSAVLRDGSNYLRQIVRLQTSGADVPVREVRLVDLQLPDSEVVGTVKGSPVVSGNVFLGFEHPLSMSRVDEGRVVAALPRELPIRSGSPVTYSSVIGVVHPGQLRRDFLRYLERERAHPYRTFLHYNSWYDLGYFNKYDETGALDRINAFGTELHNRRGVTLDSFLFDDGWDDPASLWHFHPGFPNGFVPLRQAAANYGAAPGIWLSPWGGYGKPKEERLQHGREAGFETNARGFALSGPKYFERFRETCLELIEEAGVNQFKIDGTGNVNSAIPGSRFDSDFAAAIALIADLRAAKPDLYVNLTTGTYPSPFWLQVADSIWRGGEDHSFAGVGTFRQRWITYRDADTYKGIVRKGPLFPLNSLMLHGLIYARFAKNLDTDPADDFPSEVHDYFGTGTQLQEMYITPSLLSAKNWDALAQAAKWSRDNASTLVDTHWVGGDPAALDVYGWAAWSPAEGILTLRNPSDKPQSITIDVQTAFELPSGAPPRYRMHSPFDAAIGPIDLRAGQPRTFDLKPFEVLTLESDPVSRVR